MKKEVLLALLLAVFNGLAAQTVILERNVAEDTVPSNYGPNSRHYATFFMNLTTYAGPGEKMMKVAYNNSMCIAFGIRYKYQFSKVISSVTDLYMMLDNYGFERGSSNTSFPDTNEYNFEAFRFVNFGMGTAVRFNFGKRGESLGNYADLGVRGDIISGNYSTNDLDGTGRRVITVYQLLDYVNPLAAHALVRAGRNHFSLIWYYRLTDFFRGSAHVPVTYELPRFRGGIEVTF